MHVLPAPAVPGDAAGRESLPALRARRRELLEEVARAQYWRRLARARLDLAVAAAAHPELPTTPHPALQGLNALVLGPAEHTWDLLLRLSEASRALEDHHEAASRSAEVATGALVERYAEDPTACLTR